MKFHINDIINSYLEYLGWEVGKKQVKKPPTK